MNVYCYRAFNKQGNVLKGTIFAPSANDFLLKLQEKGLELISWHESWFKKNFTTRSPKHQHQDLVSFCSYLYYFLKAGLSISHALNEMQSVFHGFFQSIIVNLLHDIQQGALFSQALQKQAPFMGPVLISLVIAGEKSGNLETVLQTMIQILHQQNSTRKRLEKAFRYPLLLAAVLGCVFVTLFFYLVPPFIDFFEACHFVPSWETKLLISFYEDRSFWATVFGGLCGIGVGLFFFSKKTSVRLKLHRLLVKIPGMGPLWLKMQLRPFLDLLTLLLGSQIDLLQSLKLSKSTLFSPYLRSKVEQVIDDIRQGQKLSQALERALLFPAFLIRMVQLGEETSQLQESLQQLSVMYAKETEDKLDILILGIEPGLLITLGLLMMWLITALFLPLYENLPLLQEVS
ncbi:MAG: type II secretion system F family protein [Alphaproteobacteria bacterium]